MAFLLTACTNEIITPTRKQQTLSVTVEQTQSRATVDTNGQTKWTTQDLIGTVATHAQYPFRYTSTTHGIDYFTGETDEGETIRAGYFPYQTDAKIDGNSLTLHRDERCDQSLQTFSPMVSTMTADGKLNFRQTGAILCVTVGKFAEENTQLIVESSGTDAPLLSGDLIISDITASAPTYTIQNGTHRLVYDITNWFHSDAQHPILIPLQVGLYPTLTLKFTDKNGNVRNERTLHNINAQRAHMLRTPVIEELE